VVSLKTRDAVLKVAAVGRAQPRLRAKLGFFLEETGFWSRPQPNRTVAIALDSPRTAYGCRTQYA